jgi:TRAP-type mannitol/chloroaromatic compound transport system permease small subunit
MTETESTRALVAGGGRRDEPGRATSLLWLLGIADRLAAAGAGLSAFLLLCITVLFVLEILARALGEELTIVWEYSGYFQAIAILLGSAYTLNSGGHIRVGLLLKQVSPPVQRLLEAVCTILGMGGALLLAGALSYEAFLSFDIGRQSYFPSETPLWIPQATLALSALLLVLAFVTRLIRLSLRLPVETAGAVSLQEG